MKQLFKKHDWENWLSLYNTLDLQEKQDLLTDTIGFLFGYLQKINNYITLSMIKDSNVVLSEEEEKSYSSVRDNYLNNCRNDKYTAISCIDYILTYYDNLLTTGMPNRALEEIQEAVIIAYDDIRNRNWDK